MKMKRFFAILLTLLLTINTFGLTAFAEETQAKTADVYVTIADDKGQLVLVQEKITVTDIDNDGTLTIDEALYATHEAKYEGGATAGYLSYVHSDYGLSLGKLWGNDSGNFGYYVNNASAWSLADEVKEGDYINAFVYTDAAWGDTYCYFDKNAVETKAETEVTLTLSYAGYDADWNPVALPVANATIIIDGAATEYKTDAEGKVTLKIAEAGTYVIGATSDTQILVPPVCVATVKATKANVYVTIADGKGKLALTQEEITVTDIDGDEELTINDALFAAHEAKYEGGATAGYSFYVHPDYGLSLGTLWGNDSGNFGYYVNNASAWSLADQVKAGDYINAFVYTDAAWGDTYCYFDKNTVESKVGTEVALTLSYAGYDAEWNPVVLPVANATITIDGVATEYKTDAEGKVALKIAEAGTYVISAISDTQILVPPVCMVTVSAVDTNNEVAVSPKTGDSFNTGMFVMFSVVSCACVILSLGKRKNVYEK